jgi:plasmid maintenance system antidote protein VapI
MLRIPTYSPPTHPMEAQVWLNLQLAWDLYQATHSANAAEIAQIKPLQVQVA